MIQRSRYPLFFLALFVVLAGCSRPSAESADGAFTAQLNPDPKPATASTREANSAAREGLPFDDDADFERAARGRLAGPDELRIAADDGSVAWDLGEFAFVRGEAPDTVNPSLWRQARLNMNHGLFEVVDGIYQVRGYDLSNVSFLRGETGWIVIDPLISVEAARAALALVNETLGERPVRAVVYTHSHVDHFGGVRGVTTPEAVARGDVRILAPKGFSHHAVSENVLAGNVMSRRAGYMFGRLIDAGPRGRVDSGLGKGTSKGRISMLDPTDIIGETGTRLTVDGVEMVFQYTPNAEAPAEMMFYLPQWKAFCVAEEANANLHNLYTLRGAQVRNGRDWAHWLDEAIDLFGSDLELVFGSHHWPRWGRAEAIDYLAKQRDLYRYIHDQTLRLANQGRLPAEIAEEIRLPESLSREWYNRGYYGTVRHNAKATYQLYLGWFDGNPAHLDPLPEIESAARYVRWMGGADEMIRRGREAFDRGEYRWVAEVIGHLVFADPSDDRARWLQADALEQLGYQAESGPWRNFYLTGALELRQGVVQRPGIETASPDIIANMSSEMIFDVMSVRLNGERAADADTVLAVDFTDRDEHWLVEIGNGVMRYRDGAGARTAEPDLTLRLTRGDFLALLTGQGDGVASMVTQGRIDLEGSVLALVRFGGYFDTFPPNFEIVRP